MEALSLEVLLSSFSERKQKFVRQREGGTASQSRKREQRHGAMGGHPVGRQESTRFWISPEITVGFSCPTACPYCSYFFLLVFECRCAYTRETPDYCLDQTISMFLWPSSCTRPTLPLQCSICPWGDTERDPSVFRGLHWCTAKAACRNDLWSLFSNTSSLPLPCSLHQGILILVNKGVMLHLAMCFPKLQRRCENYYL